MVSDLEQVRADVVHLQGQIEGGLIVLKWGLAAVGGTLIGLVAYIFVRLEKVVETLRARSHDQANQIGIVTTRVTVLEAWRQLREKAAK